MAVCEFCENDLSLRPVSCADVTFALNGGRFEPVRWGTETGALARFHRMTEGPCDTCRTPRGGVHHPWCCLQQCPACRGQLLGCDCVEDGGADELDAVT
jgi:hypothetical protein